MSIIDNSFGGVTTIPLLATNVVLSSAQYQNAFIIFTGAITANITITFPAIGSAYTVQNLTTNSSSFTVTAATTAAATQSIGLPPGVAQDIFTDGFNVKFRNMGKVGEYWDYAGSGYPNWVTACTIFPWIMCDGTVFSSAIYPQLTVILGGTTTPDLRGRTRYMLNQGTGRIIPAGGIDGDTRFATGGTGTGLSIAQSNLPNVNFPNSGITVQDTRTFGLDVSQKGVLFDGVSIGLGPGSGYRDINGNVVITGGSISINNQGSANSGGSGNTLASLSPGCISGVTMIRGG